MRPVGAEEVEDKFRRGNAAGLGFGINGSPVNEDLEGALGALLQDWADAEFGVDVVRKTCGALGVAQSQAAIDNANVHARLVVYCW